MLPPLEFHQGIFLWGNKGPRGREHKYFRKKSTFWLQNPIQLGTSRVQEAAPPDLTQLTSTSPAPATGQPKALLHPFLPGLRIITSVVTLRSFSSVLEKANLPEDIPRK